MRAIQMHTAVVLDRTMYVFGGSEHDPNQKNSAINTTNSLFALNLDTLVWTKIRETRREFLPCGRIAHTAVVYQGCMYVFGGQVGTGSYQQRLNDLWEFNPVTSLWRLLPVAGSIPVPRFVLFYNHFLPFFFYTSFSLFTNTLLLSLFFLFFCALQIKSCYVSCWR